MVEEQQEPVQPRPFGLDQLREMTQHMEAVAGVTPKKNDRAMLFVCYGALLVQPPTQGTKLIIDILSEHLK